MAGAAGGARTLVVDPEPLFARGVASCLSGLVHPAPVLADADARVDWPGPGGTAIVGVRPGVLDDLDRVQQALQSRTPVIVIGTTTDPHSVDQLVGAGVRQVLARDCPPADLRAAVLGVGQQCHAAGRAPANGGPAAPTRRELEVVALLARGLSNREIAGDLFISEHTVRNHLGHVFAKLSVASRTQAVIRAGEVGWLRLPG